MTALKHLFKTLTLTLVLLSISVPAWALETVKLAQFGKEKFMLYLPLYVAMEAGYFADEGIEVDLVFAGNDDQIFAAVASGSVDFGMGDPVFTAIAQEKGFPAKTVAMMITKLGLSGYTNNPKIPMINKPEDLSGLRIGSFPKPSTTYTLLDELIHAHPQSLKDTTIVQAGMGAQLPLLEAGKADIAIDLEPTVSKLEAQGYRVVFNLDQYTEPQVITGLMTRQDIINKKPQLVQGMTTALQRAIDTIHHNHEKTSAIARKLFPDLKPEIVENALRRMNEKNIYPESVIVPDNYWQRTLKTRLDTGELKHPQTTETSVDNSFAQKAQEQK